jgi:hypothetical protein
MNFYEFSKILDEENIHRRDPVRNAVASIENYWSKPGKALTAIQEILFDHGYLIPYPIFSVHDRAPDHRQTFNILKKINPSDPNSETADMDSDLIFSWHWISDDKVEVTAYLS